MQSDGRQWRDFGAAVTDLPRTGSVDDERARELVTATVDEDADGTGDGVIASTPGHAYGVADAVAGVSGPCGGMVIWKAEAVYLGREKSQQKVERTMSSF